MRDTDLAQWAAHEAQARAIVNALGQAWALVDVSQAPAEWHDWQARRKDNLYLSFSWPNQYAKHTEQGRLTIRGVYPRDRAGQTQIPSRTREGKQPTTEISIDANKPAETIAKEIISRLVVSFEPLWMRAVTMANRANAHADQRQHGIDRILAAVPGAHRSQNSESGVYFGSDQHAYAVSMSGDSVRFEAFSCPIEVAIAVLRLTQIPDPPVGDEERDDLAATMIGALAAVNQQAIQAAHEAEDPHCTCNDYIASHAARLEAGS